MEKPSPKQLVEAAGISPSYASMILSDDPDPTKRRTPARSLAIFLFRRTGWRHEVIAGLSEDDIATLERLEPYQPREAA